MRPDLNPSMASASEPIEIEESEPLMTDVMFHVATVCSYAAKVCERVDEAFP